MQAYFSRAIEKIVDLIGHQSCGLGGGFRPRRASPGFQFPILMSASSADDGEGIDVPSYFLCPISLEIMRDPVTLPSGITYDRSNIERWIFSGSGKHEARPCCPVTRQALAGVDADLTPNHTLRRLIQAWCVGHTSRGFERLSTPRPPFGAQIAELIEEARRKQSWLDSIRKLRSVVGQSEKNKRLAVAAGAPEFLVSVIRATCPASADAGVCTEEAAGGEGSACEEALSVLHSLQISTSKAWSKLMLWNEDLIELLIAVLKGANRRSRAHATAILKPLLEALPPHSLISLKQGLFEALVKVVRDQISHTTTKVALRILARLFMWGRNNVKAARAGAVIVLLDLLMDTTDRVVSEAAMVLLELLCRCADGRAELLTHAAGVALVCKKILRVSPLATERAVGVLHAVSKFSATPAVVREMMQVGVASKLCLVLQTDCGEITTREMAKDILRLHSWSWKKSPCFPQQLLAAGFISHHWGR